MIAQVLNRDFVLAELKRVQAELGHPSPARRGIEAGPSLSPEERSEASHLLQLALEREQQESTGQSGYESNTPTRRGAADSPPPLDDYAYLSHQPAISLLQSALTDYFLKVAQGELVPLAPSGRRGAQSQDPVGAPGLRSAQVNAAPGRRVFDQYSTFDPRWIASAFAMGVRCFRDRHAFNVKPATPQRIANRARLILVGDWGSGLPRAQAVGRQMRNYVLDGRAQGLEQHVIHLGDVYYSGWQQEYERNFLPYWPVRADETDAKLRSWCLNGNHDMYCGGHAYYDFLLADPRFAAQERSSFFSLHNGHWDIFGLDTAHEDAGLHDPQLTWLQQMRASATRRSMLLSHHQLFSVYEKPSVPLQKKIGAHLLAQPVDVWFWGHEHRCVFYRESEGVKNARLLGHGGVPVYMNHAEDEPYPLPAFYQYRKSIARWLEKWAYFGFAVVDLDGPHAQVRYVDEFGTIHQKEVL